MEEDLMLKQLRELDVKFNMSERSARALVGQLNKNKVNLLLSVVLNLSEQGATINEIVKVLICQGFPDLENNIDSIVTAIRSEKYDVEKLLEISNVALKIIRSG